MKKLLKTRTVLIFTALLIAAHANTSSAASARRLGVTRELYRPDNLSVVKLALKGKLESAEGALADAMQDMMQAREALYSKLMQIADDNRDNASMLIENAKKSYQASVDAFDVVYNNIKAARAKFIEQAKAEYQSLLNDLKAAETNWLQVNRSIEGVSQEQYQEILEAARANLQRAKENVALGQAELLSDFNAARDQAKMLFDRKSALAEKAALKLADFKARFASQIATNKSSAAALVAAELQKVATSAKASATKIKTYLEGLAQEKIAAIEKLVQLAREQVATTQKHLGLFDRIKSSAIKVKDYAVDKAQELLDELKQTESEARIAIEEERKSDES